MPTMASANRHVLKEPRKTFHAHADFFVDVKHVLYRHIFTWIFAFFLKFLNTVLN